MGRKWLVTCDLSERAEKIAVKAANEISSNQGQMILVYVYHIPPPPSTYNALGSEMTYASSKELAKAMSLSANRRLESLKEKLIKKFPELTIYVVVREGDTVEEILAVAKERKAVRIIVGTHGRKGMEHFFLGSVAEKVVRLSPVSVLVVKIPQK